jgi:hypothetical protein
VGAERCEDRSLSALVFVLNGNAFSEARPSILTANAAQVLEDSGNHAIQLSYPTVSTPAAVQGVAAQIKSLSHGQPVGIVGFSAGGTLALHLAENPALRVTDVLAYYGPPDLRDYLSLHRGDRFGRYVRSRVPFTPPVVALLSGPSATTAHIIDAFGLSDPNVLAGPSTASFRRDFPQGHVYSYPGPHGVSIRASPAALEDFLEHLP